MGLIFGNVVYGKSKKRIVSNLEWIKIHGIYKRGDSIYRRNIRILMGYENHHFF